MKAKQTIIKFHLEGISKRQIAKKVNKSRNTVSKYIKEFEMSRHKDIRNLPITEDIMKTPVYKKRNSQQPVLNAVAQLENIRQGYVTTDQILFICEQSFPTESHIFSRDEATNQSESNMKAYADMFNQIEEGVTYE